MIAIFITAALASLLFAIINKINAIKKRERRSLFLKKFRYKDRRKEKIDNEYSSYLMIDPERDISIGVWEEEKDLREKADIHKTRLSKFGRSKMNGELIYKEKNGKIYKLLATGEKKYV